MESGAVRPELNKNSLLRKIYRKTARQKYTEYQLEIAYNGYNFLHYRSTVCEIL